MTVHETAKGLHNAGVMDQITMREFDRMCLPSIEQLRPEEVKQIREAAHISQAVLAALLNTTVSTVQKWEIGQKKDRPELRSSCCIWCSLRAWELLFKVA